MSPIRHRLPIDFPAYRFPSIRLNSSCLTLPSLPSHPCFFILLLVTVIHGIFVSFLGSFPIVPPSLLVAFRRRALSISYIDVDPRWDRKPERLADFREIKRIHIKDFLQ